MSPSRPSITLKAGPSVAERLALATYEEQLSSDLRWALAEGSRFFEDQGAVQITLRQICAKLDELKISYAVVGGMALYAHGYRRFTEDVDLLVSAEGLKAIHENLEGRGYVELFQGSRALRDSSTKVRVEFLVSGQFPGDGKPKPVAFPQPNEPQAAVELYGIRYLALPTLIELKLASGQTSPSRLKDLADVLELIKILHLPAELGQQLNPFVSAKYAELWAAARSE